jgi:hypothetical protein
MLAWLGSAVVASASNSALRAERMSENCIALFLG